ALAGYLVIDLLDEEDELHWVVAVHADPEKTELVRELRGQYPPTLSTHPVQVALRTGEPQLLPDLQAETAAMAHDAKHARAIRRIANTSGIVAPLAARGRTLGAISLGTIEGQPRFDESDLAMAMELGRRISLALDNARLFADAQERAHAAEALCNRVAILAQGRLVAAGPLSEMVSLEARGWELVVSNAAETILPSLAARVRQSIRIRAGRYALELPLDPPPERLLTERTAAGAHLVALH